MSARPGGEQFRKLREVLKADPRHRLFVTPVSGTTNFRPIQLRDFHRAVRASTLHAGVPDEVWVRFETARNLWLYSWFVYRFSAVAESEVYACLERALRLACQN